MPRKAAPNGMHYLTAHDGLWRISMGVPRQLRDQLGTRLVKSTGTKSLGQAKMMRDRVIPEFKKKIEAAWAAVGGKHGSLMREALATRQTLEHADDNLRDFLLQGVEEHLQEILDEESDEVEIITDEGPYIARKPRPDAVKKATEYRRVLAGDTPIALYHQEFVDSLPIKPRSKLDEPRALSILLDWMEANDIEWFVENMNKRNAVRFMDYMNKNTDLSWASKAKYFGRIKVYWKWLSIREVAKENVFRDLTLYKPETDRADSERPYTDTEAQKILMGKPMEGARMMDVIMIAALTGARLDAVIDLKVADLSKGYFTFKKQKKEKGGREIPVHPDLSQIVARRIKGKKPEDDLFPEWPGPSGPSAKPRSSYFSKRYTKYTSDIGVRDEVEGHRRSKVNFHSWRRWFITKLERLRIREPLIAGIVGHTRPGITLGVYSGGPEFEEAKEAIAQVRLPPLDGTPVVEERSIMPRRR
ncbi:integrase [uncultured Methylobacterium sp.]|uniref:integrase n=1 Tax=uncultured Methylobacterium sp. TaxID=157278 RepID=UPI00260F5BB9|nr:integrase [uncultured Methylobacterium sp.]